MLIRWITYIAAGLILVVITGIGNTRFGWSIDFAWILVALAVFARPSGMAPVAGLIFGLVIDRLSGTTGFYAVSYMAIAVLMIFIRRVFYLDDFLAAWIVAVAGAEILWLFFWIFAKGIQLIGGAARSSGILSPFIISTIILFPLVYLLARAVLFEPSEKPGSSQFSSAVLPIDRT